jgi:hypothetical protein
MPESPFRSYILGFRDFVMSDDLGEVGAADAVSCFLGLVLEKLEKQPGCILPIIPQLLPTIRHVATNQESFGARESIYGSFQEKLVRIEALYRTPRSIVSRVRSARARGLKPHRSSRTIGTLPLVTTPLHPASRARSHALYRAARVSQQNELQKRGRRRCEDFHLPLWPSCHPVLART